MKDGGIKVREKNWKVPLLDEDNNIISWEPYDNLR